MTPKLRVNRRYTAGIQKRRKPNPDQAPPRIVRCGDPTVGRRQHRGPEPSESRRARGRSRGTTSFYFRTRSALLRAVAERMTELDLATLQSVANAAGVDDGASASTLATLVIQSGEEAGRDRTKARYELTMQATRDPAIAATLQRATDGFTERPGGCCSAWASGPQPSPITDQRRGCWRRRGVAATVHGDRIIDSPERLDGVLSAIIAGILGSSSRDGPPTTALGAAPPPAIITRPLGQPGLAQPGLMWFSTTIEFANRAWSRSKRGCGSAESTDPEPPRDADTLAASIPAWGRIRRSWKLWRKATFRDDQHRRGRPRTSTTTPTTSS